MKKENTYSTAMRPSNKNQRDSRERITSLADSGDSAEKNQRNQRDPRETIMSHADSADSA